MKGQFINIGFDSLLEAIAYANGKDYNTEFLVDEFGFIDENDLFYYPGDIADLKIIRLFAPYSDPDEESVLYLLNMKNGKKGWLSDTYSVYSDGNLAAHLNAA